MIPSLITKDLPLIVKLIFARNMSSVYKLFINAKIVVKHLHNFNESACRVAK